jgi:hypothetical protein
MMMIRMMKAGFVLQVHTDETWKARRSPVEHLGLWQNGNFGGDRYDVTSLLTAGKTHLWPFLASLLCKRIVCQDRLGTEHQETALIETDCFSHRQIWSWLTGHRPQASIL